MFSVDVRLDERACVLALRGVLDFDSAVQLREAADGLLGAAEPPSSVVADCTGLEFCDSTGISCLIVIYQRLQAHGGVLRLAAAPASVARIFRLTGLDQAISVHETVHQALGAGGGVLGVPAVDGVSGARAESERRQGDDPRTEQAAFPDREVRRRSDV